VAGICLALLLAEPTNIKKGQETREEEKGERRKK
jgi:hypothetical protein